MDFANKVNRFVRLTQIKSEKKKYEEHDSDRNCVRKKEERNMNS